MIIIRCLGSKWSASASIAAIWGALLFVALVCLPHKLRATMVSGIVGLGRDVDAEFVEAGTAAFASAKSEPLGTVAAGTIVSGPQPGGGLPFSPSEITSALKRS